MRINYPSSPGSHFDSESSSPLSRGQKPFTMGKPPIEDDLEDYFFGYKNINDPKNRDNVLQCLNKLQEDAKNQLEKVNARIKELEAQGDPRVQGLYTYRDSLKNTDDKINFVKDNLGTLGKDSEIQKKFDSAFKDAYSSIGPPVVPPIKPSHGQ